MILFIFIGMSNIASNYNSNMPYPINTPQPFTPCITPHAKPGYENSLGPICSATTFSSTCEETS
jgi:hypothetical protein